MELLVEAYLDSYLRYITLTDSWKRIGYNSDRGFIRHQMCQTGWMMVCKEHVTVKPIMQDSLLVFNPGTETPGFYFFSLGAENAQT